jgi:hypothetical protein
MPAKSPRQTVDKNFYSKELLHNDFQNFFTPSRFYFCFGAILWQCKKTMNNLSEEIGFLLLLYFDRKSMTYLK